MLKMTSDSEERFRVYTLTDGITQNQYMTDWQNCLLYHPLNCFIWNKDVKDSTKLIPVGKRVRLKSSFIAKETPDLDQEQFGDLIYPLDKKIISVFERTKGDALEEFKFPKVRVYLLTGEVPKHRRIAVTNDENLLFNYEIDQRPNVKSQHCDYHIKKYVEKPQALFDLGTNSFHGRLCDVGTPVKVRYVDFHDEETFYYPELSVASVKEIPFSLYFKFRKQEQEGKFDLEQIEGSVRNRYKSQIKKNLREIRKRKMELKKINRQIKNELHAIGKAETLEGLLSTQLFGMQEAK